MKFFGNVTKLEAAIEAADNAINPALTKANVLSLKVDGKDIPLSDAPLANRIAAFVAIADKGENDATVNQLTVTNAELAARNEKLSGDLATVQAFLGGAKNDNQALTNRAETAEAAVTKLTADKAQLKLELSAAQSEYQRVLTEQAAFNTELSKACLAIGCLQLTDTNGIAIKLTAPEEQRLEAANKIPPSEKLKAYQGGLNLAMTKLGLTANSLPGAPVSFVSAPAGIVAQHNAIKDPTERALHYRKNKEAIDAAYRNLSTK